MDMLYPYERLMVKAENMGVMVREKTMPVNMPGLYCDGVIHLEDRLSYIEKNCIMAEEIGHHLQNTGNIINLHNVANRQQERRGQDYAYNELVGLDRLVAAYKAGCTGLYDTLEFLDVTEPFFNEAMFYHARRYGHYTFEGDFIITFNAPGVNVRHRLEVA
jgi:hypothetical protein